MVDQPMGLVIGPHVALLVDERTSDRYATDAEFAKSINGALEAAAKKRKRPMRLLDVGKGPHRLVRHFAP